MTAPGPAPQDRPSSAIAGGRLGRIVRGYLGACFVAAWGIAGGLIVEDLAAGTAIKGRLSDLGIVVGGLFIVMLVAAAPLATAAIVATETRRVRTLPPFVACGGLIGIVIEAVASLLVRTPAVPAQWTIFIVVALVGGIAGGVYWLLAVRGTRPPQVRDNL